MKKTILFLQIPRLDTEVGEKSENLHFAAVCLRNALEKSTEGEFYRVLPSPRGENEWDDRHLMDSICKANPSILAVTLYLWNIERTLDVLKRVRERLKKVVVVAGGPEVARDHPFLFHSQVVDVAVSGEGEMVFPEILHALRSGQKTNFNTVAWREGKKFRWGRAQPPVFELGRMYVLPTRRYYRPDQFGMAYMETIRGCPLHCSYCAYGQRRVQLTSLQYSEVMRTIKNLIKRGAKEIRFVDPTFNAHPEFRRILSSLVEINSSKKVKFFAELRAETITLEDAQNLVKANFGEIEAGVQSRNPQVLKLVHRPNAPTSLDRGIKHMLEAGINLTVDIMYGLPGQTLRDVKESLEWAIKMGATHLQAFQTLLLPGTHLRQEAIKFGFESLDRPPYSVLSTPSFSRRDMLKAELLVRELLGIEMDNPTRRFIGRRLDDDLFSEKVICQIPLANSTFTLSGKTNRRSLVFTGDDLFSKVRQMEEVIRVCLAGEPHILWQFVLQPEYEEPLDLIDRMVDCIKEFPLPFQDQFIQNHSPGKLCSRRIFVHLKEGKRYSLSWQDAVDELLRVHFL